jgi:hypothetical protein
MQWLWQLIKNGLLWAVKNPVILVLIVILIVYNHFVSGGSVLKNVHVVWTQAISIWNTLIYLIHFLFTPLGILLDILSLIGSAAITIFEVEANFAIFAKKDRPLLRGIRAMFTIADVQYFILQILVCGIFGLVFLGLAYLIIFPLGLTGLAGSLLLILLVTVGYPTWYMLLATGSVICASHVDTAQKIEMVCIASRWNNLSRLFVFYLIRIGVETAAVSLAVLVGSYFHVPTVFDLLLVVVIAVMPFAIIRTGGFLLKFDIFQDVSWYREYFADFYCTSSISLKKTD